MTKSRSTRVMRLATLLLALGLLLASQASAEKRYRDSVFEQITKKANLVYGVAPREDGAPQRLRLDLYQPKGDTVQRRPVVIWVHGGGFASGDKSDDAVAELARRFARKGYVTASINYRLLADQGCGGQGAPSQDCVQAALEATHDGQAAVRWFRRHAGRYRIDKRRIGIGGTSAGAVVSCGAGVLSAVPGSSGNPGYSSAVGSFVSISGGLPDGLFVDERTAPGILFASVDDPVVPYQWSVETRDKMRSFDVPVRLTTFQGSVHVPYDEHRAEILGQSTSFLFRHLDIAHAQR